MATRARSSSGSTTTRSRSATTRVTTNHEEIRSWAEARGARPARVPGTDILRLDFPGYTGDDTLEHISWDEFFEIFDRKNLALLYQEETARGQRSNFNKLIDRETAESAGSSGNRRGRTEARSRTAGTRGQSRQRRTQAGGRSGSARRSTSRRATSSRRSSRRTAAVSSRRSSRTSAASRRQRSGRAAASSRQRSRRSAASSRQQPRGAAGKRTRRSANAAGSRRSQRRAA